MLYVHIPYCHHKCSYCGFYSVAGHRDTQDYVDALCCELKIRRTDKPLKTIYFGGGTPSLLPVRQLEQIILTIRDNYNLSQLEEVTLEANPENLTPQYLDEIARFGLFNRLSVGVQSFVDVELKMLNRVHSRQQASDAIRSAANAGFTNVSIDLIMGLPLPYRVGLQNSLTVLDELLPLGVIRHLSCYELTVEQGTILDRQLQMGRLIMPNDEIVVSDYEVLREWCKTRGFEQYEVSNYCQPGWRSRHNSRYWNRTPYIGAGAAAHSFEGLSRRWNVSDIERYIAGAKVGDIPYEEEILSAADAYNEYVMTALRTIEGIDKAMVPEEYRSVLSKSIQFALKEGLVEETHTHYRPTTEGLLKADGIAARLFV